MNEKMIKLVNDKLDEYGYKIFEKRPGEDDQFIFFCEDMIIFVQPEGDLSISFQATTKPDDAATNILILNEIPVLKITLMESFIYDSNNKFVVGDEAYSLIKRTIENKAVKKAKKETFFENILKDDCVIFHEC